MAIKIINLLDMYDKELANDFIIKVFKYRKYKITEYINMIIKGHIQVKCDSNDICILHKKLKMFI